MPATDLGVVNDQINKFWAPIFMKELREQLLLGALVNKDYDGTIKQMGDEVTVSQIGKATGELRTVGVDADQFESEQMTVTEVKVKADKRAVASFEIADLVKLQSQIGSPEAESEIRAALMFAVEKKINDYLYTLVAPSTASPDHLLNSIATMDASQLSAIRTLAAKAKWMKEKGWYGLLAPDYYEDILNAQTLTSKDFVGDEAPVVGGQVANQRFGFNLLEDNSRSLGGLFMHPDFMHLVMQTAPQFKVSDLHVNKKFAYLVSVDLVFGAKLGIDGAKKHIVATTAASGNNLPAVE